MNHTTHWVLLANQVVQYSMLEVRGYLELTEVAYFSNNSCSPEISIYTRSHLENDRDVSVYPGGRHLSLRAQLVCFVTRSKGNTVIDA